MPFRLKYETGVATTIQFIALTLLNFIHGASTSVGQCVGGHGCVSSIALSLGYFLVITICFGFLWLAGFAAQDRRSRRIAQLLIMGEGLVFLIGLYGIAKSQQSIIATVISVVEVITAPWIAWLALRLILARGGRVRRHLTTRHKSSD